MFGNQAFAGNRALFAVEFDLVSNLPIAVGVGFGLVVVVLGLVLCRKKPAGTEPAGDAAGQEQGDAVPGNAALLQPAAGRNPLWGLIVPGLGFLIVVGAIIGVVIPFYQEMFAARDNLDKTLQTKFTTVRDKIQSGGTPPIVGTPMAPVTMPEFQPPNFQNNIPPPRMPTPPQIPQPPRVGLRPR